MLKLDYIYFFLSIIEVLEHFSDILLYVRKKKSEYHQTHPNLCYDYHMISIELQRNFNDYCLERSGGQCVSTYYKNM